MCRAELRKLIANVEVAYNNRNVAKARISCDELFTYVVENYIPIKRYNILFQSRDTIREQLLKARKDKSYWKSMHARLTSTEKFKC